MEERIPSGLAGANPDRGLLFSGPHTLIHCEEGVRFGFYSGVGPRSIIYTHGSFLPVTRGYPAKFGEVVLQDFVWVAMNVCFMPGANVGSHCIINPGVVVSGTIPPNTRLQIAGSALQRYDLSKLVRFSQRPVHYHHEKIVREFCDKRGWTLLNAETPESFKTNAGYEFRCDYEANRITLVRSGREIAYYDLAAFRASCSSDRAHTDFLFFLRRRYGLTLRVDYP